MKEEVERALATASAPPGYVVTAGVDGTSANVEYPDSQEVHGYPAPSVRGSYSSTPGANISRCGEILERAGYAVELDPGPAHYTLVVRRH